jgi:hypothetical protein
MSRKRYAMMSIALLLLIYDGWIFFRLRQPSAKISFAPPECNVIHKPSSGCPSGYEMEATPRFTESDGSKQFACVSHSKAIEECVDVLNPGESMSIPFTFPIPAPEAAPVAVKRKGKT